VAEFDRRGAARSWGFRGTAEWLSWRCGIGVRAARDHVRVARRLPELPLVREAFGRGELSYSKVRALARVSDAEDERALLELARGSTAEGLERVVRRMRSAASADLEVANRGHDRRFLDWWSDEDGSLRFSGRLGADDGAAFIDAVETAVEALMGTLNVSDAPELPQLPPRGARRADALAEILVSGSPRAQVVLHVDAAALSCTAPAADERAGELCALEDGPAVPSETARRLACDGDLVIAQRNEDGTIDHGRSRRVVSPPLRASLERRDGHCRFPGCSRRHGIHAHHIRHWAHGGRTDQDNLVLLCRFHHRVVHEEGFLITLDGGAMHFRRPDGRLVPEVPVATGAREWDPPPLARAVAA
jgi:hypothetical protein